MKVTSNELVFIYNSGNIQDRKALAYAVSLKNRKVKTIDVQENPLTGTQIKKLGDTLDVEPDHLMDTHSPKYLKYFKHTDLSGKETLKALQKSQSMLKTPIVLVSDGGFFVNNFYQLVELDLELNPSDR